MPTDAQQLIYKVLSASFLMMLFLGSSLIWFVITYQKRRFKMENEKKDALLREQALVIEKQEAIETERTRIASEMHDDLGSGLTTIRYLSDKALKQAKDQEEVAQIKRIAEHSNALVRNMSEIIWAMNSRFDTAESLVSYLRRYASEYLGEHHLPLQFEVDEKDIQNLTVTGEKRRNIFLVFKEVLHNTIKYADAKRVDITIRTNEKLEIHVAEIGAKGFDPELSLEKGNGLYNCRKRMQSIRGDIQFKKTYEGMDIIFDAPLT